MREVSVFVDESGDFGETSRFYLITLVVHDQSIDIIKSISRYEASLQSRNLPNIPMHFSPLINGNNGYRKLSLGQRKLLLSAFQVFAMHLPVRYKTFAHRKNRFRSSAQLMQKLKQELTLFLFDNLDFFQSFDVIKIYYDNGQEEISKALHRAVEYALSKNALIYKDASPRDYRPFQLADFICGIELTALKFDQQCQTSTDELFFGGSVSFKKNYLKKLRRKSL
ncbi:MULTISPECIES: DUF3800 domain-containing protein [unclassified Adlercreutzia]|uniref:DUF3800 domain-containing protein n=1 Tax=unclassified Adlercreutzia TaxID=2636013 RepID=UPI0013EAB87D|nr:MULTISPECIES: DUF3800 domain-containing protein [unclassified Adlercreutzia]